MPTTIVAEVGLTSFLLFTVIAFARQYGECANKKCYGKIINGNNKEPVVGATVKVKGGKAVTATEADGTFKLTVPDDATLEISAVGFTTQQIKADFAQPMGISMAVNNAELGEVVVVGYGTAKKDH